MPERKIDPKFNIHETYRRVNIVNPYRYGSGGAVSNYEPETDAYISRVEADGGQVVDKDYVNAFILKCKDLGILSNLLHWTDVRAGLKMGLSNYVEKTYSYVVARDGVQTQQSKKPLYNGSLVFDGDDDCLFLGLVQVGDPLCLTGGGTIEARVKPSGTSRDEFMRIVDKSTSGNYADGYGNYIAASRTLGLQSQGLSMSAANLPNDIFTNTASIINGSDSRILFNVSPSGSGNLPAPPNTSAEMRIGTWNHTTGREFKGEMDFVRIWNIALTTSQLEELNSI